LPHPVDAFCLRLKIDRKLYWLHLMLRSRISLSLDCLKFL